MKYKILVVDDEEANVRMLERLFRSEYDVLTATSGAQGLELLKVHDISLIISDQRMPEMSGVEFLVRAAEMRPHCVRIILTGYADITALVEAINSGAVYKYVSKPWENADLLQTVKRGLSHHETVKAQHRQNLEIQRLRDRLARTNEGLVELLTSILRAKDPEAPGHCERTSRLAVEIGRALDLDIAALNHLAAAARLHEFANICVPDSLLYAANESTGPNRAAIDEHRETVLGTLETWPELDEAATIIRYLPEHFDGTGSPAGLKGEQIPLGSRIAAVAKAYDKFVSFGEAGDASPEAAIRQLRSAAGTRFDPNIINVLCGLRSITVLRDMIPETAV